MTKTFVCLANSRKKGGSCVAGKELSKGSEWIRPVSKRSTEEISAAEMQYGDGTIPHLLDVVQVEFERHCPTRFQTENYVINDRRQWQKIARYATKDLSRIADDPDSLWDSGQKSYWGLNDRISDDRTTALASSLYLVKVPSSVVIVRDEDSAFGPSKGRKKVRIEFEYRSVRYRLPVTDQVIEAKYKQKPDNCYPISSAHYLCISLGLPYEDDDYCYLFAAAVIL